METTWQFLIKRPLVYYCVPILGMVNHKLLDIAFWLVVEPYPSEKWWSESQLGWWHSQYDGKIIKFHGSSHIYTVNNNIINHYYHHIIIIPSLFSSYLTRFIMTLGGIDHDSIMKSSCFSKKRDITLLITSLSTDSKCHICAIHLLNGVDLQVGRLDLKTGRASVQDLQSGWRNAWFRDGSCHRKIWKNRCWKCVEIWGLDYCII